MKHLKGQGFQVMMLVVAVIVAVSILSILMGILGGFSGSFGKKLPDVVEDIAKRAYETPSLIVGPEIASVDKGMIISKEFIGSNTEIPDEDIEGFYCTTKLQSYAECNTNKIKFNRKNLKVSVCAYYNPNNNKLKICLGTEKEKDKTSSKCEEGE